MTNRNGKEAAIWERGMMLPAGFLVLLFTLFVAQLSLPEAARATGAPAGSVGGVAPAPLTGAGDDLWLPASGHAERRAAKAKPGFPEGDAPGKAVLSGGGLLLYPFERAAVIRPAVTDDAAPQARGEASFRSRAPPVRAA